MSNQGGSSTNWNDVLKHGSALSILKPDVVFPPYGSGSSSNSSGNSSRFTSGGSSGNTSGGVCRVCPLAIDTSIMLTCVLFSAIEL